MIFGSDVYLDDLAGNLGEDVDLFWRDRYGSDIYLAAYSMPSELFSVLGEGLWFDADGVPKQVNTVELAQSSEINTWEVWYRLDGAAGYGYSKIYVYDPDLLTYDDVIVIAAWFRAVVLFPSAFFNGEDFRLATYTGGPTYVADNLGVLRSPGANLPSSEGFRLVTTVEDGAVLGPELLTNGTFTDATGWTIGAGQTVSSGLLNGAVTGASNSSIASGASLTKLYEVTFDTIRSAGSIRVRVGFSDIGSKSIVASGSQSYMVTCAGDTKIYVSMTDFVGSIDNISVKEVIPTYFNTDESGNAILPSTPQKTVTYNTDWTATTFAETFDKFDISDPLKAPGWLCEPVRTNYALNSATPATHTTGTLAVGTYTLWQEGTGSIVATAGTAVGTFGTASNGTPATTTITTAGTVVLTASGTNTCVQIELGAFKTSRIYTTTTPMVRSSTIASFPTAGKIPVNDFAIRMIVVPRASGQINVYLFGSYVDSNNYTAIIANQTTLTIRKRISGVNTDAVVNITHVVDVPIDLTVLVSTVGMQFSARTFSSTWGAFTDGTINSSEAAKANAQIAATYQLGALNGSSQFTGNISLFDCVPIPSGTTDPMLWAKTHWGITAA